MKRDSVIEAQERAQQLRRDVAAAENALSAMRRESTTKTTEYEVSPNDRDPGGIRLILPMQPPLILSSKATTAFIEAVRKAAFIDGEA